MKFRTLILAFALALLGAAAFAQQQHSDLTATLPMGTGGVGARAMGMGGAFTAVADDGTAATWNPAGLSQLKRPQLTVVYNFLRDDRKTEWERGLVDSQLGYYTCDFYGKDHFSLNALQFISGTYPFIWKDRQCAVQISYNRIMQLPQGNGSSMTSYNYPDGVTEDYATSAKYFPTGGIDLWTGTFSIELLKNFHLGLSVNYLKGKYTTNTDIYEEGYFSIDGVRQDLFQSVYSRSIADRYSFSGFTADLGMLYKPHEKISFGFVYHTKCKRGISNDYTVGPTTFVQTIGERVINNVVLPQTTNNWHGDVSWPQGVGVGVAVRPLQQLTVAGDFSWTQWREGKIVYDTETQLGTYAFPNTFQRRQHDVYTERVGAEYVFSLKSGWILPVRLGYFRTIAPANYFDSGSVNYKQTNLNGVTVGGGFTYGNFQADAAYVRTMGQDYASTWTNNNRYWNAVSDYRSNQFIISVIYRF